MNARKEHALLFCTALVACGGSSTPKGSAIDPQQTFVEVESAASGADPNLKIESTELAPGIFLLRGIGFVVGNIGLLVGDDGIVVIDDGRRDHYALMRQAITDRTDAPPRFVINTHMHGDHTGGNHHLHLAGATVVGHDKVRERLIEKGWWDKGEKIETPAEVLPEVTFSETATLHLNGRTIFVFHLAPAHTDGDAVVWLEKENILFTGDLFLNGVFPYIDLDTGGNVDGYLAGQKRILSLVNERTKIVPGHGELASRTELEAANRMLEGAQARVKELIAAGKTDEEILSENPLSMFEADWAWEVVSTEMMTKTILAGERAKPSR